MSPPSLLTLGRTAVIRAGFLLTLFAGAAGCGDTDRPGGLSGSGQPRSSEFCELGDVRPCGVTLEHTADIMTCFRGTQSCVEGRWSECGDGRVTREAIPPRPGVRPGELGLEAYSDPEPCNDAGPSGGFYNPCDPSCMFYDEQVELRGSVELGRDAVPDWSQPPGTALCTHQLCETGAALDASCHACVAKVCEVDDTCCSASWTDACVALVYSECGVEPPDPPITFCDFSAFGESSVRLGNGGTGFPNVGSAGWVRPETGARLGNVVAKDYVDLRNGATVTGKVTAEGSVWVESPSTVTGNIVSGDRVDIRNGTTVTGNITAVGSIELQVGALVTGEVWTGGELGVRQNASVVGNAQTVGRIWGDDGTGEVTGNATVQPPSTVSNVAVGGFVDARPVLPPDPPVVDLPSITEFERDLSSSCSLAGTRPDFNANADVALTPGVYGDYTISTNRTLTLESGSYVFNSLRFFGSAGNGANLSLAGAGPWDISLCGTWISDAELEARLVSSGDPPDATDFVLYSDAGAGDCISIGDRNLLNGIFIAPKCSIRVFNDVNMTAALWGEEVFTNNNLDLLPIPHDDCEIGNQWGDAICDGTTPLYTPGFSYSSGDRVHYAGQIYECDVATSCAVGSGFNGGAGYWPGRGLDWTDAWTPVGACPADPDDPAGEPGVCPISLDLPEARGPYETCRTGIDCQVNSRCTEVVTEAACAHSKCAVGDALDPTCDSCVALICSVDPSCCTDTGGNDWSLACVQKVESACDASCGSQTGSACTGDACAEGLALDASCDPNVALVCTASGFEYCCDDADSRGWDSACVDELYRQNAVVARTVPADGTTICDYAVMGSGNTSLLGVSVTGDLGWYSGALTLDESSAGTGDSGVNGDVYAWGSVALDCTDVDGDVLSAGSATVDSCASVGGLVDASSTSLPAAPTKPSFSGLTCPTGGADISSASGELAPGVYGDVSLDGDLQLLSGDYFFDTLTSSGPHRILLPTTANQEVNVYVCGDLLLKNGARVVSPGSNPLQGLFYSEAGNIRLLSGSATHYGAFFANSGSIEFDGLGGTTIYGLAHAYDGTLASGQGVTIQAGNFSRAECLLRGLDPSAGFTPCPVETNRYDRYAESGTCVDNGPTHQVAPSVCSDADLAVDLPCDDDLTVCNHGNVEVPAGEAVLSFYPRAGQQFATQSPDPNWSAGTCTVSAAIPAGRCVTQTCDADLVDQDLTVFVSLLPGASVNECSTLDNWSYYVDSYSCTDDGIEEEIQVYEAECPDGTGPVWGFLSWDTSLEGASEVTFEARSSPTTSFTSEYVFVGTAESSPVDTSFCSLVSSISGCPVDLSAALWPDGQVNQDPFVELRMTLYSSGADIPTVNDWALTYSCVFDE